MMLNIGGIANLSLLLPGIEISSTDKFGVSGYDMETLAFAWLAFRTLSGSPGNLPSVTGRAGGNAVWGNLSGHGPGGGEITLTSSVGRAGRSPASSGPV